MAKIGTRFNPEERTRLETVIPLDTPYLLFVDPSSICNLKCVFCPCGGANKDQWAKDKKVNILSYENYRKIIDDACNFPRQIKTLRLYKEGEPLLNKRLPDMIRYARQKNVAQKIDFTTNGVLLNPDLNFALMDAGVDRINISVEALDDLGYEKNAGVKIDVRQFKENIRHLYNNKNNCHILIKISDVGLGEHSKKDFYDMFGDVCDEIAVENITPVWPGFDLSRVKTEFEKGIYNNEIKEMQVCPYVFYSICINSDTSVSACLMDWNHKHIVGNAVSTPINEIWNGQKMSQIRIDNLNNNRKNYETCANCGQLPYAALDNLDAYAQMIKEKLSEV